jgi:tripartite-type tricarboxylate transporter receptor subunit TctC
VVSAKTAERSGEQAVEEKENTMRKIILLVVLLVAVSHAGFSLAQSDYPNRQIEFIIPFAPGGPADTAARIIQPQLAASLGVPIVLVNKPGGGGALGADFVTRAKPDGYTVYATTNSTLTIITNTQPDITYRLTDFIPVGSYMTELGVVVAHPGAGLKTLDEMVSYAKKNPGKLNYGSAGLGTVSFFTMELIKISYGLDIAHVPFQGTGPVKNAILGGHVNLASSGLGSFLPLIKSSEVFPLVTTAPKRPADLANVPTMAEKGFPEATLNIWMGLYLPLKTPKEAVEKLSRALEKTVKDPAVISATAKAGMVIDYRGSEATRKLLESEHEAIKKAVAKLGLGKK